jgi:hypothetical protein
VVIACHAASTTASLFSCSESRYHVPADQISPIEDLYNYSILFPPWAWNSLDFELWRNGDVDAVQQILQSCSGDHSFISDSLYLLSFAAHFLLPKVTHRCVILIVFFLAIVVLVVVILIVVVVVVVLIVMVIIVAIIMRQLLSFCR